MNAMEPKNRLDSYDWSAVHVYVGDNCIGPVTEFGRDDMPTMRLFGMAAIYKTIEEGVHEQP